MKHLSIFALLVSLSSFAAVPLKWTVETSRLQPVVFDAVSGETLALEATFNSYGTPLQLPSTAALFYQTNGMGSAWWVASAAVNSNCVSATFTPQMVPSGDPATERGRCVVNCFLGSTGSIYRAVFTIRFRHGPGQTPNAIDAPVPVLDLANTVVVNPPWPTTNDFETATNNMQTALKSYVDSEIEGSGLVTPTTVTNIVDAKIADIPKEGISTNAVCAIVTNDVAASWTTGRRTPDTYLPSCAITNTAVRWNSSTTNWEVYLEGVNDAATVDGWYTGYVYDFESVNPFETVNTDYNSLTVTVGKVNFSSDVGRCIYATRESTTHNALGLVYERDIDTTVRNIASSASVTNAGAVAAAKDATSEDETWFLHMFTNEDGEEYGLRVFSWDKENLYLGYLTDDNNDDKVATRGYVGEWVDLKARPITWTPTAAEVGAATPADVTNVVENATNGLASAASVSGLSSDVSSLSTSVTAISGHLNAEDAHFVSTNYDSVVRLPEAYVEVKINGEWLTIWKEMTRWNAFTGDDFELDDWDGFHCWSTNIATQVTNLSSTKADRCWGIYDSETGGYSPEGYTQISSSNILIAANMAYQRTVTTGGNVWVLQCNTGYAHVGGDTNGFFRILDGDGNVQFEIIKGDKQELGADADGITVNNSTTPPTVTIPYSVVAAEHPKIYVCNDLTTANWKDEEDSDCVANVTWTGSSGAYVATVQAKSSPAPKLFVKATYETGGETYIRNVAPVGMSSIYLNGTKYYLGTATIDGHTVLTLSTTAPNN